MQQKAIKMYFIQQRNIEKIDNNKPETATTATEYSRFIVAMIIFSNKQLINVDECLNVIKLIELFDEIYKFENLH